MRRRRHLFGSPVVITIACGGRPVDPPVAPVPPPPADAGVDASMIGVVRFEDPDCKRLEPDGGIATVECPDDVLPAPAAGELVVEDDRGLCFRVYKREMGGRTSRSHWDEGRVRCPANIKLPSPRVITIERTRYRLDTESLTCSREIMGNPPHWRRADCPAALTPTLVGLEPDAPCSYRGVQVNCAPYPTDLVTPVTARIISIAVVSGGTKIIIGRGTETGAAVGLTVTIRGIKGTSKLTDCTPRTCSAVVTATPDEIKASGGTVTLTR